MLLFTVLWKGHQVISNNIEVPSVHCQAQDKAGKPTAHQLRAPALGSLC